ncbi:MAG: Methionine import ATP-binding protein MetN [Chlorobi bacterium]|nr:MAG: ABC-type transport system, ATPase component [Chlorobi bacterium OLB6]MBV6463233.1 Methionine import ATP-binding protein MetN [Chlorobiota bacterium]WKZ78102.1 MAG: phosphonate ABC transporter ATP-binding protein [Candidatus Kapabacteria bacterium]
MIALPMTPLLELQNITHTYPNGFRALNNISLSITAGEFIVVIGLSGSGKSTLMRTMNRLIKPSDGVVRFNGTDVTHVQGDGLRKHRAQIGMIFQHFNLIDRHSVLNNVLYGALGSMSSAAGIMGRFTQEQRTRALDLLRRVGIESKADNRADALSGGQKQRVAIARALMQNPRLVLADEPVASLDPATAHSVMDHLEAINKELGTTIVCNLHFLSLVRRYATRVIALRGGELVFTGGPDQITDEWFKAIYGNDAEVVE